MKVKTIVFDFGGVLVDWNPKYLFEDLFEDKSKMDYFFKNVCNDAWNTEQDRGRSFSEGVNFLQKKYPEYYDYIQTYFDRWDEMMISDIPENVDALYQLSELYPLYGLTNWSAETLPLAYKRFPFFEKFIGVVVSGEEKLIKPDPQFFQVLLDRYELIAEESVFIDDNMANIQAADKLGFHTIHIHNKMNLIDELVKMEIL